MQEQGIARRFSVGQIFAPWKEFYYGRLVRIPKTTDVALASQTASAYPLAQLASFNIRPNFSLFLYRLTQSEVLKYVAKKTFLPICLCSLQLHLLSLRLVNYSFFAIPLLRVTTETFYYEKPSCEMRWLRN